MIYWILGYIITLIGCILLVHYTYGELTIGDLLIAILSSLIPILGQFLAIMGIIGYIISNFELKWITNILNKKLF